MWRLLAAQGAGRLWVLGIEAEVSCDTPIPKEPQAVALEGPLRPGRMWGVQRFLSLRLCGRREIKRQRDRDGHFLGKLVDLLASEPMHAWKGLL